MKVGLFPGQGISARVLLEALPAGDPLVARASEVLCYDLRRRVESVAQRKRPILPTSLAQPAIFTASVVSWYRQEDGGCDVLLGHSLGEYAALVVGEAMTFEHGLCVVQVRGEVMHSIASRAHGGMAAVIDVPLEVCEEIAESAGAAVANDNAPGQVVIAGDDDALAACAEQARSRGGRVIRLEVTAPFHTAAMASAAPMLRDALDHVSIRSPQLPVLSNVTAQPYRAPGEIRRLLVDQLSSRVRFRESLQRLWEQGNREFHDFGPGRVAGGLAARTFGSFDETTAVGV